MGGERELAEIVARFAKSGWNLIDGPSRAWLANPDEAATIALLAAVQQADAECGNCGCEYDPLYKRALQLLAA